MDEASAFWVTGPGRGEIRPERLPARGPGEALVETRFSGISRGTETLVFSGRVPESQYGAMRAPHQTGSFPGPVKYGYSNVGRVSEGPAALVGRSVFSLFPHQTRFLAPAEALIPLPESLPPGRAVLAANMETALNALWDSAPAAAGAVTVIGAGALGCLTAYLLARLAGLSPELVDLRPERRAVAQALGLAFATPERARGERDLIIHASGRAEGLVRALELAAFEATVLELSWYGTTGVTLPLGEHFHAKRLTLKSSQVGAVAPAMRPEVSHRGRLERALALLDDPALDVLISGESRFEDLPQVMPRLCGPCPGTLCHRIVYPT